MEGRSPIPVARSPVLHTVRVRYAETDQAGMAHHSSFLPWFEEGRVELLRYLGKPYKEFEAEGLHFPVREAFCRYWGPARFDDVLIVETRITEVGGASVRFGYRITRQDDNALIAEGHTAHACIDDRGKVKRLPLEVRKLLSVEEE
ncbi:MAG: acyl-CoA thioesterase [Deltaproteobacteria bacterium]|nr:acyl-CoA thioesterase [Deltaproteobacteria bacterium]